MRPFTFNGQNTDKLDETCDGQLCSRLSEVLIQLNGHSETVVCSVFKQKCFLVGVSEGLLVTTGSLC